MNTDSKSHQCDACGGIGWIVPEREEVFGWSACPDCPVCVGSGRISERVTVDAEALCRALENLLTDMPDDAVLRTLHPARTRLRPFVYVQDVRDARAVVAAFRAVPGLRGE